MLVHVRDPALFWPCRSVCTIWGLWRIFWNRSLTLKQGSHHLSQHLLAPLVLLLLQTLLLLLMPLLLLLLQQKLLHSLEQRIRGWARRRRRSGRVLRPSRLSGLDLSACPIRPEQRLWERDGLPWRWGSLLYRLIVSRRGVGAGRSIDGPVLTSPAAPILRAETSLWLGAGTGPTATPSLSVTGGMRGYRGEEKPEPSSSGSDIVSLLLSVTVTQCPRRKTDHLTGH